MVSKVILYMVMKASLNQADFLKYKKVNLTRNVGHFDVQNNVKIRSNDANLITKSYLTQILELTTAIRIEPA